MALMPGTEWRGPLPPGNFAHGNREVVGVTVHHMDGSLASADAHFHTPGVGSSACFGIAYDGHIVQWVDTTDYDYHACQAQYEGYVGIENESDPNRPDDPPTDAQVNSIARIANWLNVPAVAITDRGQRGVGYHKQFPGPCSVAWGQTACPGQGFVDSIPRILAAMGSSPPPPSTKDSIDMIYQTNDAGKIQYYREAQGFLIKIGPETAAVFLGKVPFIDLGGGLSALAWNAQTKKGLAAAQA